MKLNKRDGGAVQPSVLFGKRVVLNKSAPDCVLVDGNLREISLFKYTGKIKIIVSLNSVHGFGTEELVRGFSRIMVVFNRVVVPIVITRDLPFAQKKFCEDNDIDNLTMLSDYKYSSFGINYGLLIKEQNILTQAIIILDGDNVVRHFQYNKNTDQQLNYKKAYSSLTKIIQSWSLYNFLFSNNNHKTIKIQEKTPRKDYYLNLLNG